MSHWEPVVEQIVERSYAIVDGCISTALLNQLYNYAKEQRDNDLLRSAGVSAECTVQQQIRGDKIQWLEGHCEVEQDILNVIESLRTYFNQTCYTRLSSIEMQLAHYDIGTFYKAHRDQFRGTQSRQFTVLLYLNPNWTPVDGGELRIHLCNQAVDIAPLYGRLVLFRSELLHEVLPTMAERFSLSGWLKE